MTNDRDRGPKTPMTDWQKFALLIFAIVAIAGVVFVYSSIKSGLAAM